MIRRTPTGIWNIRVVLPVLVLSWAVVSSQEPPAVPAGGQGPPIMVVGGNNFAPYHFLDAQGRATGFDVDLTKAVAETMGFDVDLRLQPWDSARDALARGEAHLAVGLTFSKERDATHDFSTPFLFHQFAMFVRHDAAAIDSEADLKSLRVIVQDHTTIAPCSGLGRWSWSSGIATPSLFGNSSASFTYIQQIEPDSAEPRQTKERICPKKPSDAISRCPSTPRWVVP